MCRAKNLKRDCNNDVINWIAKNYSKLREKCYFNGNDFEDIFHDTILLVSSESDKDLEELFLYRFNMVKYQNKKDANDSKAKEENFKSLNGE